jgi:hypothetical protein
MDCIISWFHNDMSSKEIVERFANGHNVVCTDFLRYRELQSSLDSRDCSFTSKDCNYVFMNFLDLIIVHALNQEGYLISLTQIVQSRRVKAANSNFLYKNKKKLILSFKRLYKQS